MCGSKLIKRNPVYIDETHYDENELAHTYFDKTLRFLFYSVFRFFFAVSLI